MQQKSDIHLEADDNGIIRKVHNLGGLELTMLIGLSSNEHCLVQTPTNELVSTARTIELIAGQVFNLKSVCIECTASTTIEEFSRCLLVPSGAIDHQTDNSRPIHGGSYEKESIVSEGANAIYNVVVAINLSHTSDIVQIQALELLRTRRIFTRSGVYATPQHFIFMPVVSEPGSPLVKHLNDFMFISHLHNPRMSLHSDPTADGNVSLRGMYLREDLMGNALPCPMITPSDIHHLSQLRNKVTMTVEMMRYLHNVVVFLRMHRGVAGGITTKASRDLKALVKLLALLNSMAFVNPAIVSLAARKVYRHRLQLVDVKGERSMQYGSDALAVAQILEALTPDAIIEDVLQRVEAPL